MGDLARAPGIWVPLRPGCRGVQAGRGWLSAPQLSLQVPNNQRADSPSSGDNWHPASASRLLVRSPLSPFHSHPTPVLGPSTPVPQLTFPSLVPSRVTWGRFSTFLLG